jgi:DNA modification methylase
MNTFSRFIISDALTALRAMADQSVHTVITSPPYLQLRNYLPDDHPDKHHEIGREPSPADFLGAMLSITDELWRVLRDDGTIWFVIGDTAAGSGGSGGDYLTGGLRDGQPRAGGSARAHRADRGEWPRDKSVCWVPQLFGASLAYGRNLLDGSACRQWITRPPITWCKTNPAVGEIRDKCRPATELIVFAAKSPRYYFDLDAIREAPEPGGERSGAGAGMVSTPRRLLRSSNPNGKPPLDWWVVPTRPYPGAHFATFPPDLITRPVLAACPPGGIVLDPFAGTGTTLAVAHGHGRSSIGIDLDERNAVLASQRVGMWLEVEQPAQAGIA